MSVFIAEEKPLTPARLLAEATARLWAAQRDAGPRDSTYDSRELAAAKAACTAAASGRLDPASGYSELTVRMSYGVSESRDDLDRSSSWTERSVRVGPNGIIVKGARYVSDGEAASDARDAFEGDWPGDAELTARFAAVPHGPVDGPMVHVTKAK
jgi:hypothetical protein